MRIAKLAAGTLLALALAGCQSLIPQEMSVADYCANPDKAKENVCRLKVEIDGQSTALSDTDMRLSEARNVADSATDAAGLHTDQLYADPLHDAGRGSFLPARDQ